MAGGVPRTLRWLTGGCPQDAHTWESRGRQMGQRGPWAVMELL